MLKQRNKENTGRERRVWVKLSRQIGRDLVYGKGEGVCQIVESKAVVVVSRVPVCEVGREYGGAGGV
jgi:hypothetical protein